MGHHKGNYPGRFVDRNAYLPTQKEIRAACAVIRSTWDKQETRRRQVGNTVFQRFELVTLAPMPVDRKYFP